MQMHAGSTSALSKNCNQVRISAELFYIFLDPTQHRHLVFDTIISGGNFVGSTQKSWGKEHN